MFGWLFSKPAPPRRRPRPPAFDAVLDLDPGVLPRGVEEAVAMAAISSALARLPGAVRIRVRMRDGGAEPVVVAVFPAGRGERRTGEPWRGIEDRVGMVALETVRALRPKKRSVPLIEPRPQTPPGRGFSEAPLHLHALEQLAALAQSVQSAPSPRPTLPTRPRANDVALTARLLAFVLPAEDRVTAAAAVERFGSFAAVLAAPEGELRRVPGLGQHSVAAIKLMHEAAIRLARAGVTGQPVLDDKERLAAYLAAALARERVEQFRILFLDERGMLKADEVQATGTVNHTPVYPREVVRRALELGASALVLVHNHPSGDPTPSRDDIEMTRQIEEAAAALALEVRDHIIVGNGRRLSFRDAGLLRG